MKTGRVAAALLGLALLLGGFPCRGTEPAFRPAALYGADVRSLLVHPEDPDLLVAGTAGGQLYLSSDGGESWRDPAAGQPFLGWVVAALRFDPNQPGRLWAALWGVWGGGLVAFSDDLGASWQWRSDELPGGQIYSLALVPGRPGWLYIGTRQGVYGSRDGGESWRWLTGEHPEMQKVTSLLVGPAQAATVFAGSWQRAYRSDDGGESWRGVFEGMAADSEVFSLTPVPGSPGEMWASTCGWVYHTLDGGGRWQRYQEGFENRRVPSFAVLPGGRLLAGTVEGAHLSADGGRTWKRVSREDLAVNAIALHPARPERVVLGTEGAGVWLSADGGASFRSSALGMTHLRVADLAAVGREVLAAVNHAGPASGIHSSIDAGRSFQHQRSGLPTILDLAVAGGRVYAATEKGLFERTPDLEWRWVGELGEDRVEGVMSGGGAKVVAWTRGALYEAGEAGRFTPRPDRPAPLAAAAVNGGRTLPTGDRRFPALLVTDGKASLLHGEDGSLLPLQLPFPPRTVTAALLAGDRLLLATSGQGVLWAELARLLEAQD